MRMIGTVLVDEKNAVRKEPSDNLLSQYYQTEMQITNVDQVTSFFALVCFISNICQPTPITGEHHQPRPGEQSGERWEYP